MAPFMCHVVEMAYDADALHSTGCSSSYLLLCLLLLRYVCSGTEILVPRRLLNWALNFDNSGTRPSLRSYVPYIADNW